MTDQTPAPYLSVVVTSRNDEHGGNAMGRFQAFLNCLLAQCRRVNLAAEVIVVEWNPPGDRPPLREALTWPESTAPCTVRFIEVPPALHDTLAHAGGLPLFQMIAKNVGIRRARGQFVLSTNLDILFSNELIDYIAARRLAPHTLYRADRYDVEPDVPIDAPLDAMMSFCRSHLIRKHTRWGSYAIGPAGAPVALSPDVVPPDAGVRLGAGWHVREGQDRCSRWASERVELLLDETVVSGRLNIEIDGDPLRDGACASVQVVDDAGVVLVPGTDVPGVRVLQVAISEGASRRLWIEASGTPPSRQALPLFELRDQLRYRVLRMWWDAVQRAGDVAKVDYLYPLDAWRASQSSDAQLTVSAGGADVVTGTGPLSYAVEYPRLVAREDGLYRFWLADTIHAGGISVNALSGDRMRWLAQADAVFAGARLVHTLDVHLRKGESFYIIVSNNHPDGSSRTTLTLHELRGNRPSGDVIDAAAGPDPVPVAAPPKRLGGSVWARVEPVVSPWLRRLFPVADRDRIRHEPLVDRALRADYEALQAEHANLKSAETELRARVSTLAPLDGLGSIAGFLAANRPRQVHSNACGDFQLLARDDWFALRGFAEFEIYSMNVDGLFGFVADAAGLAEYVFEPPCTIYHIEHGVGSGWTPEGEAALRKRIADRGVGWLDSQAVVMFASYMTWLKSPMIFNGDDWGFSRHDLPETVIGPR